MMPPRIPIGSYCEQNVFKTKLRGKERIIGEVRIYATTRPKTFAAY